MTEEINFKEAGEAINKVQEISDSYDTTPTEESKTQLLDTLDDALAKMTSYRNELAGAYPIDPEPLTAYQMQPDWYVTTLGCPNCHERNMVPTFPINIGIKFPLDMEAPFPSDFDDSTEWKRHTYDLLQGVFMHKGDPTNTIYIPYGYNSNASSIDQMLSEGNHD